MTSFLELPGLDYQGRDRAPVYVNVADIISLHAEYDTSTRIIVRQTGSEGCSGSQLTYMPIGALLDALHELAAHPGVFTWCNATRDLHRGPAMARFQATH